MCGEMRHTSHVQYCIGIDDSTLASPQTNIFNPLWAIPDGVDVTATMAML